MIAHFVSCISTKFFPEHMLDRRGKGPKDMLASALGKR